MFVKGNLTVCLFELSHHPSTWMGSRGCWNARVSDYVYIYIQRTPLFTRCPNIYLGMQRWRWISRDINMSFILKCKNRVFPTAMVMWTHVLSIVLRHYVNKKKQWNISFI